MFKGSAIPALIGLLLLFVFPGMAMAHSSLVSANPDPVSNEEVLELTLSFNEAIEPLSKVEVTDAAGNVQTLKETFIKGKTMKAVFEKPLTSGSYKADWKIISADGHPLKGSYTFEVDIPVPTATPTPITEPSETAAPTATSADSPTETLAVEPNIDSDEGGSSFDISKWILGGAVLILVAAFIGNAIKKRRK